MIDSSSPSNRKPGFKLALFACALAVMVLALGAFTRLVDAGLGCPDWPTCYGHALWPETAQEVNTANQAFPDTPVEHDKTWPEMVHRYLAQSLGFIVIGLYIVALRQDKQGQPNRLITGLLTLNIAMTVATIVYGVVMEPYAVASVAVSMMALAYLGLVRGTSRQPYKLPAFILALSFCRACLACGQ
jgi:cytochrome c oxidase assembly protein subunit 15